MFEATGSIETTQNYYTLNVFILPSNALYLLVSVSQRLTFAIESAAMSYLDETLKKALVFVKRLFDKFIVSMREGRVCVCVCVCVCVRPMCYSNW